jgi:hypothetical protein
MCNGKISKHHQAKFRIMLSLGMKSTGNIEKESSPQ